MSKISLTTNASGTGTLTIAAPNTNTDRIITLPDASGTLLYVDSATGRVGIGTNAPSTLLDLYNATTSAITLTGDGTTAIVLVRSSNDASGPALNFRKARGTIGSRIAVNSGDQIATSNYTAYDGTNLVAVSQIQGRVETITGTDNVSGILSFFTRPDGAGAALAERMRISSAGNVGIGTTTPTQKLSVTVADAAQAVQLRGANGMVRIRPYQDATNGTIIDGSNIAENAYLPLTLTGSTLRLFGKNTTGIIVDSAGNVGIGTSSPVAALTIDKVGGLNPNFIMKGDGEQTFRFYNSAATGSTRVSWKLASRINPDWSWIMYTDLAGTGKNDFVLQNLLGTAIYADSNANVAIGSTTITPGNRLQVAGAIAQTNTTSGNGAVVGEQTFQLAANGSALGPTIADFFGATSSISLEASSVYEIKAYCVFLKTTANTVTWTMTASSAPTRMVGTYVESPITGIAAGAPVFGFAGSQGATTAAFPLTGSLTTGVNHAFQFTMQVQTNAAANWRLQITNTTGTATPLAGSYYTVKKISASTGTFV